MKKIYLILFVTLPFLMVGQTSKVDPVAVLILDQMNDVIGDLQSCSFDLSSSHDVIDPDFKLIKNHSEAKVIFDGPNKMLVRIDGDKGKKGYWYNGENVIFYNFDENNYVRIDAPETIIATIDSLHTNYAIEIPAADFFYPAYTDDIIDDFQEITYLGKKNIDKSECFHIKVSNATMDVQYWISNDSYKLPKKFLIIYKDKNNMQYEATFSNWVLNPVLPAAVFEFMPPENSSEIKILAKN